MSCETAHGMTYGSWHEEGEREGARPAPLLCFHPVLNRRGRFAAQPRTTREMAKGSGSDSTPSKRQLSQRLDYLGFYDEDDAPRAQSEKQRARRVKR